MATATRSRSQANFTPETMLEMDFSKGIVSDADPGALAPGQMVGCTNFMLDKPGRIYKRGPFSYVGGTCGVANSGVAVLDFPAPHTPEIVAFSSDLKMYRLVSGTTWTATGSPTNYGADTGYIPLMPPVVFPDPTNTATRGNAVWGIGAGNDVPRFYPGAGGAVRAISGATGLSSVGGTGGRYLVAYKGRLALASSTVNEQRIWFSPDFATGVETAWDLTNSYIDADHGITGLCALSNVLLVFSRAHTSRLTGFAPPPGGNMSMGVLTDVGCTDCRSIAVWNDNAIWAHTSGVYMTSGTGVHDLTLEGGIKSVWPTALGAFVEGANSICATVYKNYYIVCIRSSTTTSMWMLDIPRRAWWHLAPASPTMMVSNPADANTIYGVIGTDRVLDLGTYFVEGGGLVDANGSTITASLITRQLTAGAVGVKNFREGRVAYTGSMDLGIEGRDTVETRTVTMPSSVGHGRAVFPVGITDEALTITISQDSTTESLDLFGLEIDYRPLPLTRSGGPGGVLSSIGIVPSPGVGSGTASLEARGLLSESYPISLVANSNPLVSGLAYCGLVEVESGVPITEIVLGVAVAGVNTTAVTRMEVGLLTSAGVTLATSGNIKSHANWLATGLKGFPLSAAYTPTGSGTVSLYAVVLQVGAWGTALQLGRQGTTAVLTKPLVGFVRAVAKSTGRTAITGTLTLIDQGGNENLWFGVR